MELKKDIRWQQRFLNYRKALAQLQEFIQKKQLSNLEEQGVIKAFEYTYELAWKTIKDFYEFQGESNLQGSRDVLRLAFTRGLVEDGHGWMDMIESRIKTVHTYDEGAAREVVKQIFAKYSDLFLRLEAKLNLLQ